MGIKRFRTITGCVIASFGVVVGMWLERFLIIVPSLGHKYLPYSYGIYRPQPVEIIIAGATFAAMTLLYVLFAKVVPIISIWELKAGDHQPPAHDASGCRRPERIGSGRTHADEGGLRAVSAMASRRSRRSTGCAPRVSPTARSPFMSAQPMEDFEFGTSGQGDVDVVDCVWRRPASGWRRRSGSPG